MQKLTLENELKLTEAFKKIYAFTVQKTKIDKDNEISEKIKSAFETADLETPVTDADLGEAIFDTAEVITSLTDTKVDDAVVTSAHGVYDATRGKGGIPFIEAIKGLVHIGKAKKEDKKAE